MKKNAIRILILLGITLSTSTSITASTTVLAQTDNKTETRINKEDSKLRKVNQTLSRKLYTKHQAHHDWSKFIKNLRLLKNNQIEIYVNSNFLKLKEQQRQDIINQAQLFTIRTTDYFKDFDQAAYLEGLPTITFCNGNYLGRSKYLNNKEFIWYN